MLPLTKDRAYELYRGGAEIYILHGNPENPQRAEQMLVETESEILGYDGYLWNHRKTEWEDAEEREYLLQNRKHWYSRVQKRLMRHFFCMEKSGRFAIYQMDTGDEYTYQFMGMESAKSLGYTIDGKDYKDGLCSTVDANDHVRQYI